MSKNNQIDEMAKATMKHCNIDNQCGSCRWSTCNECLAEVLYNAGYRKASKVAREIFEEIEKLVVSRKLKSGLFGDLLESDIAELKNKYTEGET